MSRLTQPHANEADGCDEVKDEDSKDDVVHQRVQLDRPEIKNAQNSLQPFNNSDIPVVQTYRVSANFANRSNSIK